MKYFVWLISSVNVYFGLRCFLNAIGVLQTSKVSQASTVTFAILFLGLGAAGFYFAIFQGNAKLALLISFGPWVLAFFILLFSLLTGKQR
jgi:hypothetical protein